MRTVVLLVLASLFPPAIPRTSAPPAGAWRTLFGEKDVSEWRGFRRTAFPWNVWTVEGGALKRKRTSSDVRQDLATKDTFSEFELEFEWRISPGGNSGIKYLVRENRPSSWEQASYEFSRRDLIRRGKTKTEEFRTLSPAKLRYSPIGFEFQILDDSENPDARNGRHHTTGALYDLLPVTGNIDAPAGRFNRGRIISNGQRIQHWVNGVKVLEFDRDGIGLRKRIQESKFAKIPRFGKNARGHITVQDHGDEVSFRRIRIREL